MTELDSVNEEGTKIVTVSFVDENGDAVVPKTAVWTLTDGYGEIIGDREEVDFSPLASSSEVVLSGDDHKRSDGRKRFLIVQATYDGVENDLGLNDQAEWAINDLKHIV